MHVRAPCTMVCLPSVIVAAADDFFARGLQENSVFKLGLSNTIREIKSVQTGPKIKQREQGRPSSGGVRAWSEQGRLSSGGVRAWRERGSAVCVCVANVCTCCV